MGEKSNPKVDIIIPSQEPETINKNGGAGVGTRPGFENEMPTVTTLLRRKKFGAAKATEVSPSEVSAEPQTSAEPPVAIESQNNAAPEIQGGAQGIDPQVSESDVPAITPSRRRGARVVVAEESVPNFSAAQPAFPVAADGPPPFRGQLAIDALDMKAFERALRKHGKSVNMKRLDVLGYFSSRFSEIAYFEVVQPGMLGGILGFGNSSLVSGIIDQSITAELLPSVFEMISQGEVFCGAIESLRAEDQNGLSTLGFTTTSSLGVFTVVDKKTVIGVWLCTSLSSVDVPQKEQKRLKGLLPGVNYIKKSWWPF